jgi:transposase InsO family protein
VAALLAARAVYAARDEALRIARAPLNFHHILGRKLDLEQKLEEFSNYYNENRVHQSLNGSTPGERSGQPPPSPAILARYAWRHHCGGLFQMPIAA